MSEIKVGDQLAIGLFHGSWSKVAVVHISKTGRITMANGDVLNPNLLVRGGSRRNSYRRLTPEIEAAIERQDLESCINKLNRTGFRDELTTDQLRRIVAIIEEGK